MRMLHSLVRQSGLIQMSRHDVESLLGKPDKDLWHPKLPFVGYTIGRPPCWDHMERNRYRIDAGLLLDYSNGKCVGYWSSVVSDGTLKSLAPSVGLIPE